MTAKQIAEQPFNLLRWFSLLSLLTITLISSLSGYVLFRFLNAHLLERDAVVSMEFIQSISQINDPAPYFRGSHYAGDRAQLEEFFRHITLIPNVLRANVYAKDQSIIWSSDQSLIGKRLGANPELRAALHGQLAVKREQTEEGEDDKLEHVTLPRDVTDFVESYIPVWDKERREVIGVIEMYKAPVALFDAIGQGKRLLVVISVLGGALLYAILFWIVYRANTLIRQQQHALVEAEKLTLIGEMAAAITHSLRNPLASIRTSAELAQIESHGAVGEYAADIISEVDRLDRWVREVLAQLKDSRDFAQTASVAEAIGASMAYFGGRPEKQGVKISLELPSDLPPVQANLGLLTQVLISLIANALEAMPSGGQLSVRGSLRRRSVAVRLSDTGSGISAQQLNTVYQPLVSYKAGGLGIGLALARRILARYGGHLELFSREGRGTTAELQLPVVG